MSGRVLISGATGFVGREVVELFDDVAVLTRNKDRTEAALRERHGRDIPCFAWRYQEGPPPIEAFEGVSAVIHLAGRSVHCRWNGERRTEIEESRVCSTRQLVERMSELEVRPGAFVCASAIGYYGDRGDELLDESSAAGEGFLAEVCRRWEEEAGRATELGVRTVSIRIGFVLGRGGVAMNRMLPIFKLGLGGRLGSGTQWTSWIHLQDLARMFYRAATDVSWSGVVNGVAPNPLRQSDFTRALAQTVGRPAWFPVPAFGIRLALGQVAEVILASSRVEPATAAAAGFDWQFPEIRGAFSEIVGG